MTAIIDLLCRIHICIGDRRQVGAEFNLLMLVGKLFLQLVFHTETEVDRERGKECGLFDVLVLLIVGEELGLELSVERIVPFVERLVADVAVYTEYVVTDLIVP